MNTITHLLAAHREGVPDAFGQLVGLVYADLQRIARSQRRRIGGGDTLNTTALVHEAYAKIVDQAGARFADRGHFLAVAAVAMRQILVDHARHRTREKRGGGARHAPLDEMDERVGRDARHILELDIALNRLAAYDPRLARVVECRYFAGLTEEEAAMALDISVRTVQREWLKARAWLREELAGGRRPLSD
jgi:RNA polymerase sigma factor (TIGR02999 family)